MGFRHFKFLGGVRIALVDGFKELGYHFAFVNSHEAGSGEVLQPMVGIRLVSFPCFRSQKMTALSLLSGDTPSSAIAMRVLSIRNTSDDNASMGHIDPRPVSWFRCSSELFTREKRNGVTETCQFF